MIPITLTARLGAEPELRFTGKGTAVATMRLATSKRVKDPNTGEWSDGPTTWLGATAWNQLAEQIAESALEKGTELIISGDLHERTFTGKDGQERTALELKIRSIGPTITSRQRVTVTRGVVRQAATEQSFGDAWTTEGGF